MSTDADPVAAGKLVDKAAKESDSAVSETAWTALKAFARRSDGHMAVVFEAVWEQLGAPHSQARGTGATKRGSHRTTRHGPLEVFHRALLARSQARCRALELCARLWPRSAAFRHALLRDVPGFVRAVYGTGGGLTGHHGLPAPERWAKQLRRRAAELILQWHASHAHLAEYRPLDLAKRCKHMDIYIYSIHMVMYLCI